MAAKGNGVMNDQRLEQLLSGVREVEDFERDLGLSSEPALEFPRLHAGTNPTHLNGAHAPASRSRQATPGRRRWFASPLAGPFVGLAGLAAAFALMVMTTRPAPVRVQPGAQASQGGTQDRALADARGGNGSAGSANSPRELLEGLSPFGSPIDPESLALEDLTRNPHDPVWPRADDLPRASAQGSPSAPALAAALPEDGSEHRNMVLAMYEGTDPATGRSCNQCQCVQYFNPDWGADRAVTEVSSGELMDATMDHACMNTPRRVFVIGLSGPADELPLTEDDARTIALCILGRAPDHTCSDRDTAMSSSAAACLSSNVAVRIQTWGK